MCPEQKGFNTFPEVPRSQDSSSGLLEVSKAAGHLDTLDADATWLRGSESRDVSRSREEALAHHSHRHRLEDKHLADRNPRLIAFMDEASPPPSSVRRVALGAKVSG